MGGKTPTDVFNHSEYIFYMIRSVFYLVYARMVILIQTCLVSDWQKEMMAMFAQRSKALAKTATAAIFALVLTAGLLPGSASAIENDMDATSRSLTEVEPNDDFPTANQVQINTKYVGNEKRLNDVDYYRFSLSADGYVNLKLSSEYNAYGDGWTLRLYDATGERIASFEHHGTFLGEETFQSVGLASGTYYLTVSRYFLPEGNYEFEIGFTESKNWESENNDDFTEADSISIGTQYFGATKSYNENDYYCFELNRRTSIKMDFSSEDTAEGDGWTIWLLDSNREEIEKWRYKVAHSEFEGNTTLTLDPGKYYVRIGRYFSPPSVVYNFKINQFDNYGFSDVTPGDWYATDDVLGYATSHGLLQGYGGTTLFGPYDAVTRGQIATILWRIAGEPSANAQDFSDVNYSEYYGSAIEWARSTGVISGYGDTNTFGPGNPVTRQELCVMLANYAEKIARQSTSTTGAALDRIAGSNEVASWAREQMGWAVDEGIISGEMVNGTAWVNPNGTAQRCAVAKMASVFHRDVLNLG